jgi:hemerythrin-like domain-containing protein
MNPIFDLRGEHEAMTIILSAMKKIASDIHINNLVDLFRIGQIIEFLRTFNHNSHHEKEEKILFPAILECNIPWTVDSIGHLVKEHSLLHKHLSDLDTHLHEYLTGQTISLEEVASDLTKYISLAENHISIENNILLPLAEKVLDKKKQEMIFMDFRHIQNTQVGHNNHLVFYILLTKLYSTVKVEYAEEYL